MKYFREPGWKQDSTWNCSARTWWAVKIIPTGDQYKADARLSSFYLEADLLNDLQAPSVCGEITSQQNFHQHCCLFFKNQRFWFQFARHNLAVCPFLYFLCELCRDDGGSVTGEGFGNGRLLWRPSGFTHLHTVRMSMLKETWPPGPENYLF